MGKMAMKGKKVSQPPPAEKRKVGRKRVKKVKGCRPEGAAAQPPSDTVATAAAAALSCTEMAAAESPNSGNKEAEWKRFKRACSNRKKFPMELTGEFQSDPLALFKQFLDAGEDFTMLLTMRREAERRRTTTNGWCYAKLRDLKLPPFNLPADKAASLASKSKWIWDPNFPDDKDEKMYWVREKISATDAQMTKDKLQLEASKKVDRASTMDLLTDDGLLAPDIAPSIPLMDEAAQEDAYKDMGVQLKKKTKKKASASDAEVPAAGSALSEKDKGAAAMEKVLQEVKNARAMELKITGCKNPFASSLVKTLKTFAEKQESLYQLLKRATAQGKDIEKCLKIQKVRTQWYEDNVKKVAQSMANGAVPKSKKVGKQ